MITLVGLSGSLRRQSYNTSLLHAAEKLLPADTGLSVHTPEGIPLFNEDLESATGIPPAVAALKEQIAAADGLLIATPEYNSSIPGVLKNTLDWLSRPGADMKRVFGGKAVGLLGATPGNFGTAFSQDAWLPVLRALGTRPYFGSRLLVSKAREVFDASGTVLDTRVRDQVAQYLRGFVDFARARS